MAKDLREQDLVDIFKAAARPNAQSPFILTSGLCRDSRTAERLIQNAFAEKELLIEHRDAETHFEKPPSSLPLRVFFSGIPGKVPSKRASRGAETTSELEAQSKAPSRSAAWDTPEGVGLPRHSPSPIKANPLILQAYAAGRRLCQKGS